MGVLMAKRRKASKSLSAPPGGTFGEHLREMRSAAHQGVHTAMAAATVHTPPRRAKGRPRLAGGHQVQALLNGLIDGVADAIVANARPGAEAQMAVLVSEMLVARVHQRMCAGQC